MNTLSTIVGFIALLFLDYFLLKRGLHKETAQEKMIKSTQPPSPKLLPKWYAIFLGVVCWVSAIYFAINFFF
jgi:Na+/H+ antiporter NhaD/arsenite permease-like protein